MTTPDDLPKRQPRPAGRGIPRSEDQAMVMTRMLMRWKPFGALRDRRKHKTEMHVNPAALVDPSSPVSSGDAEWEVRVEAEWERLQVRAARSVHLFVGLPEADAQVLADELDLPVRFHRRGEGLTEDYCPGRVTAQLEDGVVIAARAMY